MENIKYSDELNDILETMTTTLAIENPNPTVDTNYFILAVLRNNQCRAYKLLNSVISNMALNEMMSTWSSLVKSKALSSLRPGSKIKLDDEMTSIIKFGEAEMKKRKEKELYSHDILLAILSENGPERARKMLSAAGITYQMLNEREIGEPVKVPYRNKPVKGKNSQQQGDNCPNIKTYCTDLTLMAENKELDPLIGRSDEISEIIQALTRKTRSNPLLVGEGGCGKTAIINGLANLAVSNNAPKPLKNAQLFRLNMAALVSGTSFRGMLEKRMEDTLAEVKSLKNGILVLDDAQAFFGDKGKVGDVSMEQMLVEAIEEKGLKIIAVTTFAGAKASIGSSQSLSRKFQKIVVQPLSNEESLTVLDGIKGKFENYHDIKYNDGVTAECIRLAKRYLSERLLPDSAIDLLDESGALASLANKKEVSIEDVRICLSKRIGISVSTIGGNEAQMLLDLEKNLSGSVIGQEEAIGIVCKAIRRARAGLSDNRTVANLLFIGGPGCGKTLLAKKLAEKVYGSQDSMVRLDMSEYSDNMSVSKLIGSPPGYIGYDKGGHLTDAIRNKRHCVLLLDEIEKANIDIFNLFLQVFDEGWLSDNTGARADFRDVIIIMTSNIGVKTANELGSGIGFNTNETANRRDLIFKEMKTKFPPEFLNRIDEIVQFNTLNEQNLLSISNLELSYLNNRLSKMGKSIIWTDDVADFIAQSAFKDKKSGARLIRKSLRENIEDKLSEMIIAHQDQSTFKITVKNNQIGIN